MPSAPTRKSDTFLVVGATGLVGRRLLQGLKPYCERVLGTSRRGEAGLLPLDLSRPPQTADWLPPAEAGVAVVAAAQTKADACEADPAGSRRTNVEGTIRLIEQLWSRDYLPVFLSSDYVFGAAGAEAYDERAETCPMNEYGRQKVEVERFLAESGRPYVVLRLGRVLTDEVGGGCILDEACRRLLSGAGYSAATDQRFSTVFVDDAARAVGAIVERNLRGLFHAANEPTDRFALITALGRALGVDGESIRSCLLQATLAAAPRPLITVLTAERLTGEAAFQFTPRQVVLERMAAAYRRG